jgi:hypothetical protein
MIRKAAAIAWLVILTGCATVDRAGQPFKGMAKSELRFLLHKTTSLWEDPFLSSGRDSFYDPENQIEIISAGKSARYIHYVFVDASIPISLESWELFGNGILHSWHTTRSDARAEVARIIRSRMAENTSYGAVPETNSKQTSKQGNAEPVSSGKRRVAPLID